MRYKIVIADDHELVAKGLAKLVDGFPEFDVIQTVGNGQQLLDSFTLSHNIPDLVLLDIHMPVMNAYQCMPLLLKNYPQVKVLGLSMVSEEEEYLKLIELGAHGFFHKMGPPAELQHAMKAVMEKGVFYSDEVTAALFRLLKEKNTEPTLKLTQQEKTVLSHIGSELTYAEIAEKMGVSAKTVDGYRNSMFNKLGVKSRTTLALYAVANGYYKMKPY